MPENRKIESDIKEKATNDILKSTELLNNALKKVEECKENEKTITQKYNEMKGEMCCCCCRRYF